MESLLLQEFTTIRGAQGQTVVQPRYGWLDLGDFEDVVIYTDVRETLQSGAYPQITFQTAPAAIDSAFVALTPAISLATGVTTTPLMASRGGVSPARFLRWELSGGSATWDATLRVWVAAYGWA
jgi:hypothetical protein